MQMLEPWPYVRARFASIEIRVLWTGHRGHLKAIKVYPKIFDISQGFHTNPMYQKLLRALKPLPTSNHQLPTLENITSADTERESIDEKK